MSSVERYPTRSSPASCRRCTIAAVAREIFVDVTAFALCGEIAKRRGNGATCEAWQRPPTTAKNAADVVAEQCGFRGLADGWRELGRDDAESIAAAVLSHDLAYRSELMDAARAKDYAERFLALFDDAKYYTNGDLGPVHAQGGGTAGWDPITGATFDTGVVVVGTNRVGILWVQDED
jgi:hypothetical protein